MHRDTLYKADLVKQIRIAQKHGKHHQLPDLRQRPCFSEFEFEKKSKNLLKKKKCADLLQMFAFSCLFLIFNFYLFETGFRTVTQAGLELTL